MLEKLLKNKKIWIPIVIVVVVIAILIGLSIGKNADDTKGKEQSNISSDIDKNKESGLTEVKEDDDTQTEDTITPPESWDENEDSNANGNSNGISNDKDNDTNDNETGNNNQEPGSNDDESMSSGEVLEDKDNKQFGTIF